LGDFLRIAEARRFGGAEPGSPAGAQRANEDRRQICEECREGNEHQREL
jgi:hypothetical protein